MTGMAGYYTSRTLVAVLIGALLLGTGVPWWIATVTGAVVLTVFLWAPRSGWYLVRPGRGIAPLRRDERGQAIADRSARMAFVATVLSMAGCTVYFGLVAEDDVPVVALTAVIAFGWAVYYGASYWERRV